jgi:hypothetical protein
MNFTARLKLSSPMPVFISRIHNAHTANDYNDQGDAWIIRGAGVDQNAIHATTRVEKGVVQKSFLEYYMTDCSAFQSTSNGLSFQVSNFLCILLLCSN